MAGIQKQKRIPINFHASLKELLEVCKEFQHESEKSSMKHKFEVKDSTGLVVCQQEVLLKKKLLDSIDKNITKGDYIKGAEPKKKATKKKKKKKKS